MNPNGQSQSRAQSLCWEDQIAGSTIALTMEKQAIPNSHLLNDKQWEESVGGNSHRRQPHIRSSI